ncbi:FitA-like ribbon-helix-helix domain-containing protein [Ornithinimicrobium faecis]|uniref:Ribbon-helix-helix protein, CopG family n=1 Tax=Ornithinimicrobium faecis TaxID=2934158 RepID=A0ABY4YTC6_9MICO|nr:MULTISPECIES: ribbon-helix-helix protein, CopG family [unclassified Ornithinimicrobium]USQ79407.1 ribbon-helix-helix protein, CopG family [Ornithinimicrobium sp. HY1793]
MTDVLIRNLDDETIRRVDADAARLGLSRNEYLRRAVARLGGAARATTREDLDRFADRFADLSDETVRGAAWS